VGNLRTDRGVRWLVVLSLLAVAPTTPGAQTPRGQIFKSNAELVALNVTATDGRQRFVSDLVVEDFVVFEDGVRQEIRFFAAGQVPLDLIVLLDSSTSMASRWTAVRQAAVGFIRTLGTGDRGAVVGFARRTTVLQDLTADVDALVRAVDGASPIGVTALYTATYVALKQFGRPARQAGEVRRQALVVLSDGVDTTSPLPFDALVDQARRTGVAIYTIHLEPTASLREKIDGKGSAARHTMRVLAEETGARAFFPREARELDRVYGEIAAELAHQYAIAYEPPATGKAAGLRRIEVRVASRSDVRLRTRPGYVAADATGPTSER